MIMSRSRWTLLAVAAIAHHLISSNAEEIDRNLVNDQIQLEDASRRVAMEQGDGGNDRQEPQANMQADEERQTLETNHQPQGVNMKADEERQTLETQQDNDASRVSSGRENEPTVRMKQAEVADETVRIRQGEPDMERNEDAGVSDDTNEHQDVRDERILEKQSVSEGASGSESDVAAQDGVLDANRTSSEVEDDADDAIESIKAAVDGGDTEESLRSSADADPGERTGGTTTQLPPSESTADIQAAEDAASSSDEPLDEDNDASTVNEDQETASEEPATVNITQQADSKPINGSSADSPSEAGTRPKDESGRAALNDTTGKSSQDGNNSAQVNIDLKKPPESNVDADVIDFDLMAEEAEGASTEAKEDSSVPESTSDEAKEDTSVPEDSLGSTESAAEVYDDVNRSGSVAENQTRPASTDDDPAKDQKPKKGSVAEFFQKVSKTSEQQSGMAGTPRKSPQVTIQARQESAAAKKEIPEASGAQRSSSLDYSTLYSDAQYSAAWGFRKPVQPLGSSLPEDVLLSYLVRTMEAELMEAEDLPNTAAEGEVNTDQSSAGEARRTTVDNDGVNDKASSSTKSVNSEFVDGLDDIDKFMEAVDPPDELDVGAVGSSIQEVLVGQSAQILIKRLKLGLQFVRRKALEAKTSIQEFISRRKDEDGQFVMVTREELEAAAKKLKHVGEQLLKVVKGLVSELLAKNEDENLADLDFGADQSKLANLRESSVLSVSENRAKVEESAENDEIDAYLRQLLQ